MLNAKAPSEEKIREHLKRIDRQVSVIDTVITALTDVARLPSPKAQSFDLRDLIRSVVAGISIGSEIAVDFDFPKDLPMALADADQLAIVFRNIVRNARDAMTEGGVLTVSGRSDNGRVITEFRDTGHGMTPEVLSQIMEPFFSTKARGIGLGLAITKAVLEKNDGFIYVESEPGQGATIFVSLPSAAPVDQEPGAQ